MFRALYDLWISDILLNYNSDASYFFFLAFYDFLVLLDGLCFLSLIFIHRRAFLPDPFPLTRMLLSTVDCEEP